MPDAYPCPQIIYYGGSNEEPAKETPTRYPKVSLVEFPHTWTHDMERFTAHGAPLRLAVPVKYGIKSLKSIGTLAFTTKQPPDYWAERGYDYYSGF